MIELLSDFPEGTVAAIARGQVTRKDYEEVLIPAIQSALKRRPKLRCYYELGREFLGMDAGAMWEDFRVGFAHLTAWERIAIVTDTEWVRHAVGVFRFLVPGEVRLFPTRDAAEARRWIGTEIK